MTLVAAIVLAACTPRPPERVVAPPEGISIAVYAGADRTLAVVDDRRWVELAGGAIVLDRIDPAAALPSLVIEPLAGTALAVGACARDRLETVSSPQVRCAARGAPGRHLVRVLHVVSTFGFRIQHDVAMTAPDRATIATRFAFTTPRWQVRAELVLHDGLPGRDEPPRELARGPARLDGGIALLAPPPREVPARLRTIYDGMVREQTAEPTDIVWGKDSQAHVWVWLELDGIALPPGPIHARVESPLGGGVQDVDVPADARGRERGATRVPLWIDPSLRGMRRRWVDRADGATLADRFQLSVTNLGDTPREVWVEERLRPVRRREVARGWPIKPTLAGRVARTRLVLAPGKIERLGFTIAYEL